jgi:hypothetical protein
VTRVMCHVTCVSAIVRVCAELQLTAIFCLFVCLFVWSESEVQIVAVRSEGVGGVEV